MSCLQPETIAIDAKHNYIVNSIFFSGPYHQIARKENYKNYQLNKVLAQSIYDNITNNIDYIAKTQYNDISVNNYKVFDIEDLIKSRGTSIENENSISHNNTNFSHSNFSNDLHQNTFQDLPDHLKTHNIIYNKPNNLHIRHHIPKLYSEDILLYGDSTNPNLTLNNNNDKMYTQRCNDYAPMNGFGSNHNANAGGYVANTNNREMPNFTLQQHNMHGGNALRFADGNIPYGFYDQSNFSGTNSATCGAVHNDPRFRSPGNMMQNAHPNNYPINYGMNDNYGNMPFPQKANGYARNMETAYNHECNYNAGMVPLMKPKANKNIQDDKKKNTERKNISKVKKAGIDINIETSSGRRQGITLDLNIDIDN